MIKIQISKLTPEWALRTGLGVMYLYSGIDILRHPTAWFWAVRPILKWFPTGMQTTLSQPAFMKKFLMSQGAIEIIFAVVLLVWFLPKKYAKWIAGLTALEMAGILFLIPIDAVTFRDFGLLGGGLALFLILKRDSNFITVKPPVGQSPSFPKPEIKLEEGPVVETFDQFIAKK